MKIVESRFEVCYNSGIRGDDKIEAIPHKACAEDALSDFSSDCIEIPKAY